MNYAVGHGRHWQFLRAAGHTDDSIMELLRDAYIASKANVLFQVDGVHFLFEPGAELGAAQLMRGGRIASAFPYSTGGHVWPIRVREFYEWPNGIEGQLRGVCHGASVGWFDPYYAESRHRYRPTLGSGPLPFRMNALAYRVRRTHSADADQESRMGTMKAYLPLRGDEASADELQFTSQVEVVRPLDFHGVPLDVYTVTLALPNNFPMRVDVFTAHAVAEERLAVGDQISGVCWLFGRLID